MAVFIKSEQYDLILKVCKFCEKIDKYISVLRLNCDDVEAFKNENELFMFVFANDEQYKTCTQSFVEIKISALEWKYSELSELCKSSRNYTTAIGKELGFEKLSRSTKQTSVPEIEVEITDNGHPLLKWNKENIYGVEIWKDRGDKKGYQKLLRSYGNRHVDKAPLPQEGGPVVWKYSAIYLFHDEMVGEWSDEVEVKFMGQARAR